MKREKYRIKEPNLIGQLGEVIGEYILRLYFPFPRYFIFESNPFDSLQMERADFEIHRYDIPDDQMMPLIEFTEDLRKELPKKEVILVEVKTTIHKDFHIRGSGNRKYFQKEIEKFKKYEDVTKILILRISLGNFPDIYYTIKEISKTV